jgi:hypothetical protein
MRGRLKLRAAAWARVCTSTYVLSWVTKGVPIPWKSEPPRAKRFENHGSARKHAAFLDQEVPRLVTAGVTIAWKGQPAVTLPLGVATQIKPDGTIKERMVLDCTYINDCIQCDPFKYETLQDLHQIVQKGDFAWAADLKGGFHHVDMREDAWPHLGFEWGGQAYVFTQLPFGLNIAPRVFTKVMAQPLGRWRTAGWRCTGYLDDLAGFDQAAEACYAFQVEALAELGFILSGPDKLQLGTMAQRLRWPGMMVDLATGVVTVPKDKRDRFLGRLSTLLSRRGGRVQLRDLMRVAGKLQSMSMSFGPLVQYYTSAVYAAVAANSVDPEHPPMNFWVKMDADMRTQLEWWRKSFDTFDGTRPLWLPAAAETIVHSDAAGRSPGSLGGWGAWTRTRNGETLQAAGKWLPAQSLPRECHSTWQEGMALFLALRSFNREGAGRAHGTLCYRQPRAAPAAEQDELAEARAAGAARGGVLVLLGAAHPHNIRMGAAGAEPGGRRAQQSARRRRLAAAPRAV